MIVVPGIDALTPEHGRLFVVVGVFDGLHRGHLYLLRALRREARKRDARPAVVTFDHHPDEVLTGAAPPLLVDPVERLERLEGAGVELTVVQHFDVALRMTPYDAFVRRIADRVDLAGIVMTPDSAFGYERRGTPGAVAELGRSLGYDVVLIPAFDVAGQPVRSGEIRTAIASGDLATAATLLGRQVAIAGRARSITHGSSSGATELTFDLPMALPPPGRYPAIVEAGGGLRRQLVVAESGIRIEPPINARDGQRVRVRLPVPASTDTIRRS